MINNIQTEFGELKSVLLQNAKDAFVSQEVIDKQWQKLNYLGGPNFDKACEEYEAFSEIFKSNGVDIQTLKSSTDNIDSIYVRDASIVTEQGAILCNMGKDARKNEPEDQRWYFENKGINILGAIGGEGKVEGGDVAWLDKNTLAIAEGYRTNQEGIRQIRALLDPAIDLVTVPSPHYKGPSDVFHLMSTLSPLSKNVAVVYSPLMIVPFRNELIHRGYRLVEVPESEFDSMGCNVLAINPEKCLIVDGNPITKARIEATGIEVVDYKGDEISKKGCGGPTCLTRPLVRS